MEWEPSPVFRGASPPPGLDENQRRFVIGVDFGTTFTGISWILQTDRTPSTSEIHTVMNWPGRNAGKVPSEYTYSATGGTTYGYGIGDSQYVIRWMKMQLTPPSRYDALRILEQNLKEAPLLANMGHEGQGVHRPLPKHLIKAPVDVVHDFMSEVADRVLRSILNERDPSTIAEYPIDLVVTTPAQWPGTSVNLTLKAVTGAFAEAFSGRNATFRHVFLATEPEACAQITMKDAVENRSANLRPGDCVVIVDAGGGTVDVISYRVESINPFRIIPVTKPASGNYGSSFVDRDFVDRFLECQLKGIPYHNIMIQSSELDIHGQGAHRVLRREEQQLLHDFMTIKHTFTGKSNPEEDVPDQFLPLPQNLDYTKAREGVVSNGNLRITCRDLEMMFQHSVSGTLSLIEKQYWKLARERFRTIFLSGGFSASEYLYRCVERRAKEWGVNVIRAEDGWTAVAKGAVVLGLGLGCDMPAPAVRCPFHIGAVLSTRYNRFSHDKSQLYHDSLEFQGQADPAQRARDHIRWAIKKGDLVDPRTGIYEEVPIVCKITHEGSKSGYISVVMSSTDHERGLPRRQDGARQGTIQKTIPLKYDLQSAFDTFQARPDYRFMSQGKVQFARVYLQLGFTVTQTEVELQLKISSENQKLEAAAREPGTVVLDGQRVLLE